ncbi:UNVERIFIED_CONTAM: hypothetical protein Slati_1156800 [Sesamum latifolium]|uniref:Uncharacterized protein n=1 Tax=Sesamum latifolium TaxID=2727402 RepID=A0AAW2XFZ3_9LAMI
MEKRAKLKKWTDLKELLGVPTSNLACPRTTCENVAAQGRDFSQWTFLDYRQGKLEFDPEIEKTARRLQKEIKQLKGEASTSSESEADLALDVPTSSDFEEEVMAQNPERTINEMTSLDLNQQAICIEYPTLDVDFELKSGLIHLLPTFHGLAGEDPHKHLKEFHVVCSGMRTQGVTEEQVKLQAFPFSLGDKAKD